MPRSYARAIRRHPWVSGALIAIAIAVLACERSPAKALVYLATMLLCALAVDRVSPPPLAIVVRRPRYEAIVAIGFVTLGIAAVALRDALPRPWIGIAILLLTFPIALVLVLLAWRYSPRELGMRARGLLAAPIAIALTAAAAFAVDPDGVTLSRALEESGGWLQLLFTALVAAALSEEVTRFVLQTRVAAALRNPAAGWLIASAIWALAHVPSFADGDLVDGAIGAVRILPIGLLWGYLTLRTGSIVPAVLAHAANLWGLQNG